MRPMPRRPPELPNPIRGSQPSTSNTPPHLASATEKNEISHFVTTKTKAKNERNDPNSSPRKLERKAYKDYNNSINFFHIYQLIS